MQRTKTTIITYQFFALFLLLFFSKTVPAAQSIADSTKHQQQLKESFQQLLTVEELDYLLNKKKIKVQHEDNYPPYQFVSNGKPTGFVYDYLHLITKHTGLVFEPDIGDSWGNYLAKLKSRKLDVLAGAVKTEERTKHFNFSRPYTETLSALITRDEQNNIDLFSLQGKSLGVDISYYLVSYIQSQFPKINLIHVDNQFQGVTQVYNGTLDAYLNDVAVIEHLINRFHLPSLKSTVLLPEAGMPKNTSYLATHKDDLLLSGILSKAIGVVPLSELQTLSSKWFVYASAENDFANSLSEQEKLFVLQNPLITLGACNCAPPASMSNEHGEIDGIAADFLALISAKTGMQFEHRFSDWEQIINDVGSDKLAGFTGGLYQPEREKVVKFTEPFISQYIAVFVKSGNPLNINSQQDLNGKRIATLKGVTEIVKFAETLTDVEQIEYSTVSDMVKGLVSGEVDFAYYTESFKFIASQQGIDFLEPAFVMDKKAELRFGISNKLPLLHSILEKALASISSQQRQEIRNRWINNGLQQQFEQQKTAAIKLNDAELAYIKQNPIVHLADTGENPPIMFLDKDNNFKGYSQDYLNIITTLTGLKFSTRVDSRLAIFNALESKIIDGFPVSTRSEWWEAAIDYSQPYLKQRMAIFVKKGNSQKIVELSDLSGKTMVMPSGMEYLRKFAENISGVNILEVNQLSDVIKALVSGKADFAYYSEVLSYAARNQGMEFIEPAFLTEQEIDIRFGFSKGQPQLVSIVNKGLAAIPEQQRHEIHSKWFNLRSSNQNVETLQLSSSELSYLAEKGQLNYCVNPSYMPYSSIVDGTTINGFTKDLIKLLDSYIPTNFSLTPTFSANDNNLMIESGFCDFTPTYNLGLENDFMLISPEYLTAPIMLVGHQEAGFISNISDLSNVKIGLMAGSGYLEALAAENPLIDYVEFDSLEEGLEQVSNNLIFAVATSLPEASYWLQSGVMPDLKIAGKLDAELKLAVASRYDEPILAQIIEKALQKISQEQIQQLSNRWFATRYEEGVDYQRVWQIVIAFVLLFGVILLWNRKLTQVNSQMSLVNEKLHKEREKVEQANKKLEFVQFAVEYSGDMALWLSADSGKLVYANQVARDALGYKTTHILALSIYDLDTTMEANEWLQFVESLKGGKPLTQALNFRKKSGDFVPVEVTSRYINFGQEARVIVFGRDISERVKADKAVHDARMTAEQANEAKSAFLANMSHEIRTPMNGILGMVHLALQTNLSDLQAKYLKTIDNSTKSLLNIINDILDISKIEAGKLSLEQVEFDLVEVVDDVIELMDFNAGEKGLEVLSSYAPDVGRYFVGDPLRLSQILNNLLSNAIKFTEQGEIIISVNRSASERLLVKVIDTGIGMSKEQVERLFKSFSQADDSTTRKYGGTGLGLSISKQLVEMMDGRIWVESMPNQGSIFSFEIELNRAIDDLNESSFATKKVLVVDDNDNCLSILQQQLEQFNLASDVVSDGQLALDKVIKEKASYDLILMDWNMPGLDGIETSKKISDYYRQESNDEAPTVIMVSAYGQEYIIKAAREAGIDTFLQKPVDPSTLFDVLVKVLMRSNRKVKRSGRHSDMVENLKAKLPSLAGSRIMLVEDNPINQDIILGLLDGSNINIDIARNGREAINLFKTGTHEMVLMDLQMPIMDGYEATKIIRDKDQETPIVALTANALQEQINRTKELGMNAHLTKPIDVERLYQTLLCYISKKTEVVKVEGIETKDNIELPEFRLLNLALGLKHFVGNQKLFKKVLMDFVDKHRGLDFPNMDEAERKRVIHTIKGLSGNLGAEHLYLLAQRLEANYNNSLMADFIEALEALVTEVDNKLTRDEKVVDEDLPPLDSDTKAQLLADLKLAISSKRPKNCTEVLDKIATFSQTSEDSRFFADVEKLVKGYKFAEALDLLEN